MTRNDSVCTLFSGLAASVCAFAPIAPASPQATPYGFGVNPPGSLIATSGFPMVGSSFAVGVSNTAIFPAPASLAFLSVATAPDSAFPSGTVLPGFGLSAPGAPGEWLLSSTAPDPLATLGPVPWAGGATPPARFVLSVPLSPSLIGVTIFLQGTLVDVMAGPSLGLTNGLAVTLAPLDEFPGFVPIPAGTFQMGSDAPFGAPFFSKGNEKPTHQVTITQPFWMGRYEVSQAEFEALLGFNPSGFVGPDRPVERVSWTAGLIYGNLLTAQQAALGKVPPGYEYRLPTEAEWEYACRAGSTTEFSSGQALLCNRARFWFSHHSGGSCGVLSDPTYTNSGHVPVASYTPNAWGLYNMHGNVWEWCRDKFTNYTASAKTDPYGTTGSQQVFRGGAWGNSSDNCRSASRLDSAAGYTNHGLGFRIALAPIVPQ